MWKLIVRLRDLLRFTLLRNVRMVIQTQVCGVPRFVLWATMSSSSRANLQGLGHRESSAGYASARWLPVSASLDNLKPWECEPLPSSPPSRWVLFLRKLESTVLLTFQCSGKFSGDVFAYRTLAVYLPRDVGGAKFTPPGSWGSTGSDDQQPLKPWSKSVENHGLFDNIAISL